MLSCGVGRVGGCGYFLICDVCSCSSNLLITTLYCGTHSSFNLKSHSYPSLHSDSFPDYLRSLLNLKSTIFHFRFFFK